MMPTSEQISNSKLCHSQFFLMEMLKLPRNLAKCCKLWRAERPIIDDVVRIFLLVFAWLKLSKKFDVINPLWPPLSSVRLCSWALGVQSDAHYVMRWMVRSIHWLVKHIYENHNCFIYSKSKLIFLKECDWCFLTLLKNRKHLLIHQISDYIFELAGPTTGKSAYIYFLWDFSALR